MSISARKIIIHVILPLVAGLAIYVFFRKNTWIHHHLLPPGLHTFNIPQSWLNNFFIFNMPDFCWSYSLTSSLFIWEKSSDYKIKYLPALILLFLVAAESVQYFVPSQFTFDWLDIIAAVSAFFLSYMLNRQNERS
jgi:hypothetical protein